MGALASTAPANLPHNVVRRRFHCAGENLWKKTFTWNWISIQIHSRCCTFDCWCFFARYSYRKVYDPIRKLRDILFASENISYVSGTASDHTGGVPYVHKADLRRTHPLCLLTQCLLLYQGYVSKCAICKCWNYTKFQHDIGSKTDSI